MHAFERCVAGASIALVVCAGCAPADEPAPTGEAESAVVIANGLHLNGLHLNGLHLNGLHLNGIELNGLHLNGLHLNGLQLTGSALTTLFVDHGLSADLAGSLVGALLDTTLSDGTELTLRIDAVTPTEQPDVQLYTVSYEEPGGSFEPICGLDASGHPVQGMPLAGTWDESEGTPTGGSHAETPGVFTFACEGYALAKCVDLGYVPWRTITECRAPGDCHQLSLSALHQTCTRLLRADYCGDGTPTTRDGTLIDLWDLGGLQTDDAPTWTFEAEWTTNGASCVDATRWPTILDSGEVVSTYIQEHCPTRWQTPGCGGSGSTFFTANGFTLPTSARSLLRSRISTGAGN